MRSRDMVGRNIRVHNRLAHDYASLHGEIYNDEEQSRLADRLTYARSLVATDIPRPVVLDFGCGAGNLTRHLLRLGCDVIAADVSEAFLGLVSDLDDGTSVTPLRLNGEDLRDFATASVDMVATYSVLHHVPDYISIVREFARVLRPGGVIYIDHEHSQRYWDDPAGHDATRRSLTPLRLRVLKWLRPRNYWTWVLRRLWDPRYSPEGDIHVYRDDHIEWGLLVAALEEEGVRPILREDYLLYRRGFDMSDFHEAQNSWADMHLFVGIKPRVGDK